jgi:hypothetical protein
VVAASPEAATETSTPQQQSALQQTAVQQTAAAASGWVVRYCRCLWRNISASYEEIEAGQLLGYHFAEASQVWLPIFWLIIHCCCIDARVVEFSRALNCPCYGEVEAGQLLGCHFAEVSQVWYGDLRFIRNDAQGVVSEGICHPCRCLVAC